MSMFTVVTRRICLHWTTIGKKKTGKKLCSWAHTYRKRLYWSVNVAEGLEVNFCLQSLSKRANTSMLTVVTWQFVCTKLLAKNQNDVQQSLTTVYSCLLNTYNPVTRYIENWNIAITYRHLHTGHNHKVAVSSDVCFLTAHTTFK